MESRRDVRRRSPFAFDFFGGGLIVPVGAGILLKPVFAGGRRLLRDMRQDAGDVAYQTRQIETFTSEWDNTLAGHRNRLKPG